MDRGAGRWSLDQPISEVLDGAYRERDRDRLRAAVHEGLAAAAVLDGAPWRDRLAELDAAYAEEGEAQKASGSYRVSSFNGILGQSSTIAWKRLTKKFVLTNMHCFVETCRSAASPG